MNTLSSPADIDSLGLPDPITQGLYRELITQPFGELQAAKDFWLSESVRLYAFSAEDQFDQLFPQNLEHGRELCPDYPDFVQGVRGEWYLAVFITNDRGGGYYLLFPSSTKCPRLNQLIPHSL